MESIDVNLETVSNDFFNKLIHIESITDILDINEPSTKWNQQIDTRTNYPFYWNSDTKESLWDIPDDYKEYLKNMKEYFDELKSTFDSNFDKSQKDNVQQVKSLIGYSDSDEEVENELSKTPENEKSENIENGQDAAVEDMRKQWYEKQYHEAEAYLIKMIEEKSDELKHRINSLSKYNLCNDSLKNLVIKNETRLEDWNEGFITRERLIDKLNSFLSELSYVESSLETDQWSIVYDRQTKANKCFNKQNSDSTFDLSVLIFNTEEGEIVDSNESSPKVQDIADDAEANSPNDLANDLEEYICTELHTSLDTAGTGKLDDNE